MIVNNLYYSLWWCDKILICISLNILNQNSRTKNQKLSSGLSINPKSEIRIQLNLLMSSRKSLHQHQHQHQLQTPDILPNNAFSFISELYQISDLK